MEQTPEKIAETTDLDDKVDRDWLLQHLATHANQTKDFNQSITLWVAGGLISGVLVSGSKFFDVYTDEMVRRVTPDGQETTRALFRMIGERYYEPPENPIANNTAFIHLLDAKFWAPSGAIPSAQSEGVAWRGRISQITGFSLGQMVSAP